MFKSVNDARYTMWATVIPRLDSSSTSTGNQPGANQSGHFERRQDPDSGQIMTVWVDGPDPVTSVSIHPQYEIPCYARGYTNLGFRSSANREIFVKGEYNVAEAIQFDYPASVSLNHQSLITNIRTQEAVDNSASYLWVYEETGKPVVWEVQGTTPVTDPFGKLLRFTTVLKRSEIQ